MWAVIRCSALVVAAAGAAVEAWSVRGGWAPDAAALDLLAGGALAAAAGWAPRLSIGCRALLVVSGAAWFAATPQVVGGTVGHVAALMGALWFGPLVTAVLAAPGVLLKTGLSGSASALAWLRAVPVLSGVPWLTAAVGVSVLAAGMSTIREPAYRWPRLALSGVGLVFCVSGIRDAVGAGSAALTGVLAVAVGACGVLLIAVRRGIIANESSLGGLVVELGRTKDALSLERRLARALEDPGLRMLYRFAPGQALVDCTGRPTIVSAGRELTEFGSADSVSGVLEHRPAALADPRLREAVVAFGSLAVRRLVLAAQVIKQAEEVAESRRRLVEAESTERRSFQVEIAEGPNITVDRCLAALTRAISAAPDLVADELAYALSAGLSARDELARIATCDVGELLGRHGLPDALRTLAASVGAESDVSLSAEVDPAAAAAIWFAAAEALTNAVKHAGPARIRLSAANVGGIVHVDIRDDGLGGADPNGSGLRGVRDRVAAQDGDLTVRNEASGGTCVQIRVPAQPADVHGCAVNGSQEGPDTAVQVSRPRKTSKA